MSNFLFHLKKACRAYGIAYFMRLKRILFLVSLLLWQFIQGPWIVPFTSHMSQSCADVSFTSPFFSCGITQATDRINWEGAKLIFFGAVNLCSSSDNQMMMKVNFPKLIFNKIINAFKTLVHTKGNYDVWHISMTTS